MAARLQRTSLAPPVDLSRRTSLSIRCRRVSRHITLGSNRRRLAPQMKRADVRHAAPAADLRKCTVTGTVCHQLDDNMLFRLRNGCRPDRANTNCYLLRAPAALRRKRHSESAYYVYRIVCSVCHVDCLSIPMFNAKVILSGQWCLCK